MTTEQCFVIPEDAVDVQVETANQEEPSTPEAKTSALPDSKTLIAFGFFILFSGSYMKPHAVHSHFSIFFYLKKILCHKVFSREDLISHPPEHAFRILSPISIYGLFPERSENQTASSNLRYRNLPPTLYKAPQLPALSSRLI